MYHAVCFDLDGTLLDTIVDLGESTNAALEQMGHPTHPLDEYRYFVGNGLRVLIEQRDQSCAATIAGS